MGFTSTGRNLPNILTVLSGTRICFQFEGKLMNWILGARGKGNRQLSDLCPPPGAFLSPSDAPPLSLFLSHFHLGGLVYNYRSENVHIDIGQETMPFLMDLHLS